ncbi:MAG: hypothetical protein OXE46_01150 [Chloroflexi bacterium]|nr:hypothetical protein [Chloroflexota bacterium]
MINKISTTVRRHLLALLALATLIVAMTFPTILYVFNTEVFWLPTGADGDVWMKFWDAWYGKSLLLGRADFYFSDLLFYPQGLSLVFHNFCIPHMLVFAGLQSIMPASNAYNLTYLVTVFAICSSAYLYLGYLFTDKWISLLGAVIVGLSPFVVGHSSHPDLSLIATIPLSLYFFHRGVLECRPRFVVASAVLTGITAYIGLYVFVCLCISIVLYIVYFSVERWRDRRFLVTAALFVLLSAAIYTNTLSISDTRYWSHYFARSFKPARDRLIC